MECSMQAKLIPNPWTLVTSGSQSRNRSLQMSLLPAHLSPLHFAFSPFISSFIIYDTLYEPMRSEVNTYPEQGGRRFNGKVIRCSTTGSCDHVHRTHLSLRRQVICIVLEHFARTRWSVLTRLYAQTNAADPTNQAARTGTLGKSRQTQKSEKWNQSWELCEDSISPRWPTAAMRWPCNTRSSYI
jgi:hypothetical protein